tara:strand:+ start:3971 stop:5149 length:1179 start_codon:yes stop_codon:yes gene_type:complete
MKPYFWPLSAMVILQIAGSLMLFAVVVLAPELAPDLGIEPTQIGFYSALVWVGASTGSLFSPGPIRRFGAVRMSQLGLALSSIVLLAPLIGSWWVTLLGGLLVGFGYGPFTPGSTQILTNVTQEHERPLVLAIKQAAAPIGVMLGGALLPSIALKWGWQAALLCVTAFGFLFAFAVQPLRKFTDERRTEEEQSRTFALALVFSNSRLRNLTVFSFVFSASQMCVFTFLVIDMVERIGLEYRLAGFSLAIVQVGGFVSRLVWGYLSERWIPGRILLVAISIMGSISLIGLASTDERWSFVAIGFICALLGMTIAGWNGIFLAEVVKGIPKEQLASAVGTAVCFLYSGLVVGPALFSAVVYLTDSYPSAYMGLAAVVGFSGLLVGGARSKGDIE